MKLLALDLSSNVGHAIFESPRPPSFGTLLLKGDLVVKLGRFADWLSDMYSVHAFDGCAWERPILTSKDTVDKLELLYGLVGICYGFVGSERHRMPNLEVGVREVKKRLTGRSDADKADVIKACWSLGWKVGTDHEADACGVGLVAYRRIWPLSAAA